MNQTCSLVEPPVNPSASPDSAKDSMTREEILCSHISQLLIAISQNGWFGKTSPAFCHQTEDGILAPSSRGWRNSGMGSPTEFLTLNSCEQMDTLSRYPKDGVVCSLSDILETGDVPQRYFLTPKACAGILRRAEKRGKKLPEQLRAALEAVAIQTQAMEMAED